MIYNDLGMSFLALLMTILSLKYIYILFKATELINEDAVFAHRKQETSQDGSENNHETYRGEYCYTREEAKKEKKQISISGNISRFTVDLNFFTNCHDPYVLLNCSSNDTQEMIKKRYRELIRKWHPDYIRGMGATQTELAEATLIVQIINSAYNNACKRAV